MTLYSKYGLRWFGIKVFEGLDNPQLRDIFLEMHEIIAIALLTLIVLHVLAALKHQWLDRDEIMSRILLRG
jgi:cytochrome b561